MADNTIDAEYAVLWRDGTIEPVESVRIARDRAVKVDGAGLYRGRASEEWRTLNGYRTTTDMLRIWSDPAATA